jgi:hypothetical protein
VEITKNYMRFDNDWFSALAAMPDVECKVYLDLIRRTWGQLPPRRACETTFSAISVTSRVSIGKAITKAITGLEARGYIEILYTARGKGDRSVIKVLLPKEVSENKDSRTEYKVKEYSTNGL